jgi:hypothetical protein
MRINLLYPYVLSDLHRVPSSTLRGLVALHRVRMRRLSDAAAPAHCSLHTHHLSSFVRSGPAVASSCHVDRFHRDVDARHIDVSSSSAALAHGAPGQQDCELSGSRPARRRRRALHHRGHPTPAAGRQRSAPDVRGCHALGRRVWLVAVLQPREVSWTRSTSQQRNPTKRRRERTTQERPDAGTQEWVSEGHRSHVLPCASAHRASRLVHRRSHVPFQETKRRGGSTRGAGCRSCPPLRLRAAWVDCRGPRDCVMLMSGTLL